MDKREDIIRKLNGIRAKMNNEASTPAEVESYTRMYNSLMQKYNLTETDLDIKKEGIAFKPFNMRQEGKAKRYHEVEYVVPSISRLTNTEAVVGEGHVFFFGTMADIQYAEFLYRLCHGTIEQSWKAYSTSLDAIRLKRAGRKPSQIYNTYRKNFAGTLAEMIEAMALENERQVTGNALVVLKNQLILAAMEQAGVKPAKTINEVATYEGDLLRAANLASEEARKVRLRQEAGKQEVKLLGGK